MPNMIPKIAIVEDNQMYAAALEHSLKDEGYQVDVFLNSNDFLNHIDDEYHLISLDHSLPDISGMEVLKKIHMLKPELAIIFLSGQEDVNVVVEAYENGARNYIVKNDNAIFKLKQSIKEISHSLQLEKEVELLSEEIEDREKYKEIIGESAGVRKVLKLIQRVEKTDNLVMITGDSGTGKELVANAIHKNSLRRRKPFIAVNMAAIPDNLLEDELFGHEKGAFTGATSKRKGKFEEANGGTIFLDEIGEMDIKLQSKLLRVLQEKKISRLGGNKEISLDIRFVAATNRNLGELVKKGLFREDLYYRIQGFLIHVPSLKERKSDIMRLCNHFLKVFAQKHGAGELSFDPSAEEVLLNHPWTGNIRELIALLERTVLMRNSQEIAKNDLIFSDRI